MKEVVYFCSITRYRVSGEKIRFHSTGGNRNFVINGSTSTVDARSAVLGKTRFYLNFSYELHSLCSRGNEQLSFRTHRTHRKILLFSVFRVSEKTHRHKTRVFAREYALMQTYVRLLTTSSFFFFFFRSLEYIFCNSSCTPHGHLVKRGTLGRRPVSDGDRI